MEVTLPYSVRNVEVDFTKRPTNIAETFRCVTDQNFRFVNQVSMLRRAQVI